MTKEAYINHCRILIEKKMNRGSYLTWTNGDYEVLSDRISDELKEYLSTSSLKRIFGKVNYASDPNISTLSILARFVGFKDWYDLVNQYNNSGSKEQPKPEPEKIAEMPEKKRRNLWLPIAVLLIVGGAFLGWWLLKKDPKDSYSFNFRIPKPTSPSNVVFEYDISDVQSGDVYIDFNDHFARAGRKKLDKTKNTITHTYRLSSVYHPLIYINNKVVDTLMVPVYSDGWEFVIAKYMPTSKEFFPVSQASVSTKNGILSIPASEVYKYTEDTVRDYWIKYRYIHDFKIEPEQLEFKIRGRSRSFFKNNCNEIDVWLVCSNNNVVFKIFDPGCGGEYSKVQLGNKILDGNYNDLSAFGHNLSDWRDIVLKMDRKKVSIYIEDKKIYEGEIEGEIGSLSGFVIHSKGTAEFDYVNLSSKGEVLFRDDF